MSEKATDISGGTGELAESGAANAEIEPQATPIAASDNKEETDEATHPVNAANAEQRNQQHAQSPSRTASPPDVRCESPTQSCSDRSLLEPNELEELDDVVPELDLSYLSLNNLDFLANGTAGPVALSDHLPVPPDGGYGWVIVLAAFFSNFVVDGMANCFAVFLPEYQRFFNSSKGTTALVGSLLIGSYLLIGPVAGGLVNKYGARPVVMAGAVISTVAIVVSVYSTNIFIFMIIFGVCG
uniref:Major facilitator superfamily (MFS) profile domain-containing protein n=1 Tax=Plectus sambesii TaxID=2011161 RepID=A0A914XHK8_9BILA